MLPTLRPAFAAILLGIAGTASAATITVTLGTDPIDVDWQTATIDDLPGPDGEVSFSEAMIAANNTPGHDTIAFNLPVSEWQLQWLLPGRAVIWSSYTYFWRAFDEVTIDGTTQTEFTGDSNPDGAEVAFFGGEIYLNGNDSVLRGIDGGSVNFNGSNELAEGNTGGINLSFFGGSGSVIRGNDGGTLKLDRTSSNLVVGNVFDRIRIWGSGGGQPAVGNVVGGPNPEDRNYLTGFGSYNSEGLPSGFSIQLFDCEDTLIENNSIGTTPDGLASGSAAATMGIRMEFRNSDTVIRDNRIAGVLGIGQGPHHAGQLFGWAIYVIGGGSGLEMTGNTIGLDANGDAVLGSVYGIDVGANGSATLSDIRIGGPAAGEGNVIAGHLFNGVTVGRDVPQVRIQGNSIYGNDDLGIDLVPTGYGYGVSPNDPLDADSGGNGLQNFPEIAAATTDGVSVRATGMLHSSPSGQFTLDFFASPECDGNGFGEGRTYLGSIPVATDGAGNAPFDATLPGAIEEGWVLTATATLEPLGATSEFSACVTIEGGVSSSPETEVVSTSLRLSTGEPNPFRTATTVRFDLSRSAPVRLAVFDAAGRAVRTLLDAEVPAGAHQAIWDGRDEGGREVESGAYFFRLESPAGIRHERVIRVR